MIMEKRVAEILRSLHTTDARELAKAFAFEPKRSYDLACAAVARTGDLVKAAELVESGWSHEDVVIPVRLAAQVRGVVDAADECAGPSALAELAIKLVDVLDS